MVVVRKAKKIKGKPVDSFSKPTFYLLLICLICPSPTVAAAPLRRAGATRTCCPLAADAALLGGVVRARLVYCLSSASLPCLPLRSRVAAFRVSSLVLSRLPAPLLGEDLGLDAAELPGSLGDLLRLSRLLLAQALVMVVALSEPPRVLLDVPRAGAD